MKGTSAILALFLSFIFIAISFSASPETLLIGKWKGEEGTIEFVKNGILIINNQGARYRIIDKERVEFDMGEMGMLLAFFSGVGPRPIFRFTLSDDELILTPLARPNETEKFRRVKVDASGNDADTYLSSGVNNIKQGNYQQAIKDFDKAIELDPKNGHAYFNRGVAYRGLGNYQHAIKNYDKVIELDPKETKAYVNRGNAYNRIGNFQQAIKDSDKAIKLDPKNGHAYFNRGVAYSGLGNYQQAINDTERVIEIDPQSAIPYYNIACYYSLQNNAVMACQWLKKAIEKGYNDWEHLKKGKDFDNIRNTSCYQEIIRSH